MSRNLDNSQEIRDALESASQDFDPDQRILEDGDEWNDEINTIDTGREPVINLSTNRPDDQLYIPQLGTDQAFIIEFVSNEQAQLASSQEASLLQNKSTKGKRASRSNHQGRPRDSVRNDFAQLTSGKAECKACKSQITNRVDVMKNHQRACKGARRSISAPTVTSENVQLNPPTVAPAPTSTVASVPTAQETDAGDLPSHKRSKWDWDEIPRSSKPMKSFFDKLTKREQHELDIKLAKMIYACNLPFHLVENLEFRDFVQALRPAYTVPSEKQIANDLLDEVFENTKEDLTKAAEGKEVVMIQDGWSSKRNQPIIAHSIQIGIKNHFYNAVYTGLDSKTADYCLQLLLKTIDECEANHRCKVIGIVTDNNNCMLRLRQMIESQRPKLFVYGCNAHFLNNVGKRVTPQDKIKDVTEVQKYLKNHHYQSAVLEEHPDGKRPILPNSTRWNSQLDCLQNFQENHAIYLDAVRKHPEKFTTSIANLIKDPTLYENAVEWQTAAKPIAHALDKAQSNTSLLSDLVAEWISLRNNLKLEEGVKKYFDSTQKLALSPVALASYIFDPRYKGKQLAPEEISDTFSWIRKHDEEAVIMAIELMAKNDEKFPAYLLNDDTIAAIHPKSFWKSVNQHKSFSNASCRFAEKLMMLPASSSGIERCFSTLGSILSPIRNRLGVLKASKLCTIYQSLRFMRNEETFLEFAE